MPRRPRLELPGVPLHVTQRGVNRAAIFLDNDDRDHYRRLLHDACIQHDVAVHACMHACVLMGFSDCKAVVT